MPELSITIVNWNSFEDTLKAIASIQEHAGCIDYELIVVDNGTVNDAQAEALSRQCTLIRNNGNRGFAAASNQGVEASHAERILLFNPDCRLTNKGLAPMLQVLDNTPKVGVVGPLIHDSRGDIVPSCRRPHPGLTRLFLQYTLLSRIQERLFPRADRFSHSGTTPSIQGSCMLFRRSDFQNLGGFDERIPLFLDDMDLCWRYEQAGFRIHFCAETIVVHQGGTSIQTMKRPLNTSLVNLMAHDLFFLKHKGFFWVLGHHGILFLLALFFLFVNLVAFIPLWLGLRSTAFHYLEKHVWMLVYSVTCSFFPSHYPKKWPYSLFKVLNT